MAVLVVEMSILGWADFDGDHRIWLAYVVTQLKKEKVTFYSYGDMRWAEEGDYVSLWLVSQKMKYRFNSHLDLGGGYSYMEGRPKPGKAWNTQHWFELEATPKLSLAPDLNLILRNRWESRWIESRDFEPVFKSRHRLFLKYRTSFLPGMESMEISNEIFYNYTDGYVDENRFFPLSIHFKTSATTGFDVFCMMRSLRSASDQNWQTAYITGATFRWNFDAFINNRSRK